ncbi:mitochondrial import receptor subunit TOM20 homolog B [Drosophila ananassae]|nr:mitochondrial import receptor subunit TOM20 homolog B [Drosophila ananassae]
MTFLGLGLGALMFLGYCVYFDRKRRSDPNYRRLVHERRHRQRLQTMRRHVADREQVAMALDPNDQAALELYFLSEMKTGEELISQGRLDEGLTHLANAIALCAQPTKLLEILQATFPECIFRPLVAKLLEMRQRN